MKEDFCKIWQVGFTKYETGKSEQQDNTKTRPRTNQKPTTVRNTLLLTSWKKIPLDPITLKDFKHLSNINKSSHELLTRTFSVLLNQNNSPFIKVLKLKRYNLFYCF